jgi:GntR family transcriptional regulator/MocR family aminotransferase
MPKRAVTANRPEIIFDRGSSAPLYKQLYERLRTQILSGQLEAGARLPSTRTLASELGVSRNTTAIAYELLLLEGYIEARVGDGTRVARLQPERLTQVETGARTRSGRGPEEPVSHATGLSQRGRLLLRVAHPSELSGVSVNAAAHIFRAGHPDRDTFPYELWARLVARRARQSLRDVSSYQHAAGYYPLREAIAAQVGITRGVYCSPEQVILTSGSQGAVDLAARALLDPGDAAWVEDPGYPGTYGALLGAGARLVPVPVDGEGLDVDAGRRLAPGARLVSVTPSHQFPTGVTMSLRQRLALLEWAREACAWILEDDYDSEYRFSGRPLEALQGLDTSQRVIYIGTFSKVLFPALRLGYLIVPDQLVDGFLATRHYIDVHVPLLEQMALSDFMVEGHYARHLRRMRLLYLERRNTLVAELRRTLSDMLDVTVPEAGMHLVAWLPPDMDDREAARLATAHGVQVAPVSTFSLRPLARGGLMLGFAGASQQELRDGVRTLATALRSVQRLR